MKKAILIVVLSSITAFAVDYSAMSITELQAARASVPTTDLPAFQSAVQSKVQSLTQTERQALKATGQQYKASNQTAMQSLSQTDRQALQGTMSQNRLTGGGMGGRR